MKIKFLQSAYILPLDRVVNANEEETVSDELGHDYVMNGLAIEVAAEKIKPAPKTTKATKTEGAE